MADSSEELMQKLVAMSKLTDDYDGMLRGLEREEKRQPDEHMVFVLKGWALHNLKRYDEAEKSFDRAIELNPRSAWAFFRKGQLLADINRDEEALECLNSAVRLKPRRPDFWVEKGLLEDRREGISESFKSYEKAIRLGDKTGWAQSGKARILTYLNRFEEALDAIRIAMKQDPEEEAFKTYEQVILDKIRGY